MCHAVCSENSWVFLGYLCLGWGNTWCRGSWGPGQSGDRAESQPVPGGVLEQVSQARLGFKGGTEAVSQSGASGRRGGGTNGLMGLEEDSGGRLEIGTGSGAAWGMRRGSAGGSELGELDLSPLRHCRGPPDLPGVTTILDCRNVNPLSKVRGSENWGWGVP